MNTDGHGFLEAGVYEEVEVGLEELVLP